jgi:hypothetical protein
MTDDFDTTDAPAASTDPVVTERRHEVLGQLAKDEAIEN